MNQQQIQELEAGLNATLPESFKLYIKNNPQSKTVRGLSWSSEPRKICQAIREELEESMRFDIENSDYWPTVFGPRPEKNSERLKIALDYISRLPILLPINSLRNLMPTSLTDMSTEAPILSFHQFTDTIYMYANLEKFLKNLPLGDDERQNMPQILGWSDIFDGLGASEDQLYAENKH